MKKIHVPTDLVIDKSKHIYTFENGSTIEGYNESTTLESTDKQRLIDLLTSFGLEVIRYSDSVTNLDTFTTVVTDSVEIESYNNACTVFNFIEGKFKNVLSYEK